MGNLTVAVYLATKNDSSNPVKSVNMLTR